MVSAVTIDITARVQGCGDGVLEVGEECDGAELNGETCASQGFRRGSLSCSSVCTFNTSACTMNASSTTVYGGSGAGIPDTNVVFTGLAYPYSKVSILKDGQVAARAVAEDDGSFSTTISGLSTGHYRFTVFAEDSEGILSRPYPFTAFVNAEVTTKIGDVFLPPTIRLDRSTVAKGGELVVTGQSTPGARVSVYIDSTSKKAAEAAIKSSGEYLFRVNTTNLSVDSHTINTRAALNKSSSPYSKLESFTVTAVKTPEPISGDGDASASGEMGGDINGDGHIDLVDFSILAAWYKKPLSNNFRKIELEFFNGDGVVNMVDFSIMAFYWTG